MLTSRTARLFCGLTVIVFCCQVAAVRAQQPRDIIPSKYVGPWVGEAGWGESFTRVQVRTASVITEFGHTIDQFEFAVAADGKVTGKGAATYQFRALAPAHLIAARVSPAAELAPKKQKLSFTISGWMLPNGKLYLAATPAGTLTLVMLGRRQTMPAWNVFGHISADVEPSKGKIVADAFGVTVINGRTTKIGWKVKTKANFEQDKNARLPPPEEGGRIPKAYVGRWQGSGWHRSKRHVKVRQADALHDMGAVINHFEIDVAEDGKITGKGKASYWFDVSSDADLVMARQAPCEHLEGNVQHVDFDIRGAMTADGKMRLEARPSRNLKRVNSTGGLVDYDAWNVFVRVEGQAQPGGELWVKAAGVLEQLNMPIVWKAKKARYKLEVELKGVVKQNGAIVETNYANWYPQAAKDEVTAANYMTAKATILDGAGQRIRDGVVKKFTFALVDVSRQPGVCMNWPNMLGIKSQTSTYPDLQFDKKLNRGKVTVTGEDWAKGEKEGSLTEAEAVIASYDWGGYGYLKVTAEIRDTGEKIVGYLKGEPNKQLIPTPHRRPDSKIAEYARLRMNGGGMSDDNDGDDEPAGNGFDGDGLTFYEEYRGFHENRKHIRGDLKKKDLFVCVAAPEDRGVFQPGILLFAEISGLKVHYKLLPEEVSKLNTRTSGRNQAVVNFNHTGAPLHRVDQHVLQIRRATLEAGLEGISHGFGPPKYVPMVEIAHGLDGDDWVFGNAGGTIRRVTNVQQTVAHELGHAVGIMHHGEGDKETRWVVAKQPDGKFVIKEGNVEIALLTESGTVVDPVVLWRAARGRASPPANKFVAKVYFGAKNGQHSGDDDCVMRYSSAWFYRSDRAANIRYWVAGLDSFGFALCNSAKGTGVNAPTWKPQSRFGDSGWAGPKGCKGQIVINDAYNRN